MLNEWKQEVLKKNWLEILVGWIRVGEVAYMGDVFDEHRVDIDSVTQRVT